MRVNFRMTVLPDAINSAIAQGDVFKGIANSPGFNFPLLPYKTALAIKLIAEGTTFSFSRISAIVDKLELFGITTKRPSGIVSILKIPDGP